jgi:Protein kinase domain
VGCADVDTLMALVENALSDSAREAIAIHAASCEHCHAVIDGLVQRAADTAGSGENRPIVVAPGTTIGRYVIGERLGAGGMGVVYAATDSELHRRVAVKLVRGDGADHLGSQGRDRLMREARVLARLSHPNVVTVFDVGAHGDGVFLAMELVDGGSLTAWLRRAPRLPSEILDRMIEAGRGLAAAHADGVVHRDVKPDNVLVGSDGRARMTDFGLARFETSTSLDAHVPNAGNGDLTRTGALMGTPMYMAPEQLHRRETDARTDQWSFCAMLYEVIAGVRPFRIDDFDARDADVAAGKLAPPAPGHRVPAWIRRIVARGLAAEPEARWPSMDAVVAELERGRGRRERLVKAVVIAGVLAIGGLAAFGLTRRATHDEVLPEQLPYVPPVWVDQRPGCNCPFSACANGCVSQCNAHGFHKSAEIPGINSENQQHAVLGASSDGNTILYLTGRRCGLDRLMLAQRHGPTYVPFDITDKLDRKRVAIFEGCCTLAASGTSIVMPTPDQLGFVRVKLTDSGLAIDPEGELTDVLPERVNGVTARHPVLSADELALYYRVVDTRAPAGDSGPLDGVYMTTRADVHAPFTPGKRLPGRARGYEVVSGVSADGLSLFMTSEFATHVLVRKSTSEPWGDPWEGVTPAMLPGWRAIPVESCRRIVTTWTPGGCQAERMVWLEAE